jgi:hypothetical protein
MVFSERRNFLEAPDGADECCYLGPAVAASRLENLEPSSVELAEFENDLVISDWIAVMFDVPPSFSDVDGSVGVEEGSG